MIKHYYVYILECSDSSLYTGMTNNLEIRMNQHINGYNTSCYTYDKRPVVLKWFEVCTNPSEAIRLEKKIKGWSRRKKIALIEENWDKLVAYSKNYSEFGNQIHKRTE